MFTWTDATGAANPTIQVRIFWRTHFGDQYHEILLNDAVAEVGTVPPAAASILCSSEGGVATTVYATGGASGLTYNPGAQNSVGIRLKFPQDAEEPVGYQNLTIQNNPLNDTTSGWAVEVTVSGGSNTAPNSPTGALKWEPTGGWIRTGVSTSSPDVRMTARVSDPDGDECRMEVEVKPLGQLFKGLGTVTGPPTANGTQAEALVEDLGEGSYHWRMRAVDAAGIASEWVSYGDNEESEADFTVDPNEAPNQPPPNSGGGSCGGSAGAGRVPVLLGLLLGLAVLSTRLRR